MLKVVVKKALPDFSLEVDFAFDNGILVLFGPSGAGKSTLLQCISGLMSPDSGRITFYSHVFYSSDQQINTPARGRNIGYVFQDYALFPHMTVKQNAMYGIKGCKGHDNKYKLSVLDVFEMLKITHLQERYPNQLSGGERQRVALARALMMEPDLLLLDEPLSALDEEVRGELCKELKQLQRQWDIPFVLVTHSRTEMQELADFVVVLERGNQPESIQRVSQLSFPSLFKVDNNRGLGII